MLICKYNMGCLHSVVYDDSLLGLYVYFGFSDSKEIRLLHENL